MDRRPLVNGTGVASYARVAREALSSIAITPLTLQADRLRHGMLGRWGNWLDAIPPCPRPLQRTVDALSVRDLFRVAQVHFDIHRKPLALHAPFRNGLVHWSYPLPLHVLGWVNLYTVHDAIPLTHPELTPIDPQRHLRLLKSIGDLADHIITVSDASRDALIDTMKWAPERIVNCGAAVEEAPAITEAPRDYLIMCGSIEPRKNIGRVIESHVRSGVDMPLVIAGPNGWKAAQIHALAVANPKVRWAGYRSRQEITALIGGARALLMPSLAEGFGLPLLEAMMLGTPVLTSDRGAPAEIVGDAALLIDPTDTDAMTIAIRRLACENSLVSQLSEKGLVRAEMFSTKRFADRLVTAYGTAIAARRDARSRE